MDAFMMKRTPKLLELIEQTVKPPQIGPLFNYFTVAEKSWEIKYCNKITRCEKLDEIKKTIIPHRKFHSWFNKLVTDLKEGKNLYIFYPMRSGNKAQRRKYYYDYSIEELGKMIAEAADIPDTDYNIYHGNTSNSEKYKLKDVNAEWKNKRFILTTSTISVGVNYSDDDWFDKIYITYADFVSPRDVNQSLMRIIRHTKEAEIEYFHITDMIKMLKRIKGEKFEPIGIEIPNANNKELYWKNMNFQSAFDFIQGHLRIEMGCHGQGILNNYFKMTGYKYIYTIPSVEEYVGFNELVRSKNPWDYDSIDIIDSATKEKYYTKMMTFDETFTQREQIELDRHFSDMVVYGEGEEQYEVKKWLWQNPKSRLALVHKHNKDSLQEEEEKYWLTWRNISQKHNDNVPFSETDKYDIAKSIYLADLDMAEKHNNISKYESRLLKLSDNILFKRMLQSVYGHDTSDTDFWEDLGKIEESYLKYYKNPQEILLNECCFLDDD